MNTEYPLGVTLTREPDREPRHGGARPSQGFVPPTETRSRTVFVGAGLACTVSDDEHIADAHFTERDLAAEARAARESILHPPGLRDREHGR